jgi:hypothetical protein
MEYFKIEESMIYRKDAKSQSTLKKYLAIINTQRTSFLSASSGKITLYLWTKDRYELFGLIKYLDCLPCRSQRT